MERAASGTLARVMTRSRRALRGTGFEAPQVPAFRQAAELSLRTFEVLGVDKSADG